MNKYIGTLLGGCVGDILGSQTEGMPSIIIRAKFGDLGVDKLPTSMLYTDDTEMTLVLARHLVLTTDIIDMGKLHNEYADIMQDKGYSKSTRNILNLFRNKMRPFIPAGKSDHNGAVMRICPLGLLNIPDNVLLHQVRAAIYYTHGDSEQAVATAFLHCKLINALVTGKITGKHELFMHLITHSRTFPCIWPKINLVKFCLNASIESITDEILGDRNAFQIKAIDAFCCAIYIFFTFYNEPLKAVCFAASLGGDTDTIGKLVGDLAGALHGTAWIPWKSYEGESELTSLGEAIYRKVLTIV